MFPFPSQHRLPTPPQAVSGPPKQHVVSFAADPHPNSGFGLTTVTPELAPLQFVAPMPPVAIRRPLIGKVSPCATDDAPASPALLWVPLHDAPIPAPIQWRCVLELWPKAA
mmetsp:Transcript_3556/g.6899  ORF Transcript_3556/g.6899 Transcript_3556/m.6899 type:complete len:111 (-) Transcript_3556:20-352(-)